LVRENGFLGLYPFSIDEERMVAVGRAFSSLIAADRETPVRVVVGFDGRPSSWELQNSLIRGIASGGVHVISIGRTPAPLTLFAMRHLKLDGAAIVTGGHLPRRWNGVRLYERTGPLGDREIHRIESRIADSLPRSGLLPLAGDVTYLNLAPDYLRAIENEFAAVRRLVKRDPVRVAILGNHGDAGILAPRALARIGCAVTRLRCTPAGERADLPAPDPADPALQKELASVMRATRSDLGFAFDGGGERLVLLDDTGDPVAAADLLGLAGETITGDASGARIACDLRLSDIVEERVEGGASRANRGTVTLIAPGHRALLEAVGPDRCAVGAGLNGEFHFADRDGGSADATYAALRFVEILARARAARRARIPFGDLIDRPERYRAPEKVVAIRFPVGIFREMDPYLRERRLLGDPIDSIETAPGRAIRVRCREGWGALYRHDDDGTLRLLYEGTTDGGFHGTGRILRDALTQILEPARTGGEM